jgi:hypothetical protein
MFLILFKRFLIQDSGRLRTMLTAALFAFPQSLKHECWGDRALKSKSPLEVLILFATIQYNI